MSEIFALIMLSHALPFIFLCFISLCSLGSDTHKGWSELGAGGLGVVPMLDYKLRHHY